MIGGIAYYLVTKPIWEGKFQIVLSEKSSKKYI